MGLPILDNLYYNISIGDMSRCQGHIKEPSFRYNPLRNDYKYKEKITGLDLIWEDV